MTPDLRLYKDLSGLYYLGVSEHWSLLLLISLSVMGTDSFQLLREETMIITLCLQQRWGSNALFRNNNGIKECLTKLEESICHKGYVQATSRIGQVPLNPEVIKGIGAILGRRKTIISNEHKKPGPDPGSECLFATREWLRTVWLKNYILGFGEGEQHLRKEGEPQTKHRFLALCKHKFMVLCKTRYRGQQDRTFYSEILRAKEIL